MNDLFLTKEQQLKNWMRFKKYFNSVDVTKYGLENAYLRAPRTARDFVHKNILRRIPDDEAIFKGLVKTGNKHLAWYEYIN